VPPEAIMGEARQDQDPGSAINIDAAEVNIGGDVVGRDKIVTVGGDLRVYNVTTGDGGNTRIDVIERAPQVVRRADKPLPPRRPRGFVGRAAELAQLDEQIAAREVVAVIAADGAGKSTLLKQAANGAAARALPDGVAFIEGIDEHGTALGPDDLTQRLFEKFFISDPAVKVSLETAETHLAHTQPLVILDGVQLPAAYLDQLPNVFPQGAVLIAARRSLPGEAAAPIDLPGLSPADAAQLFALRSALTLDDGNRAAIEAICARLGGAPLAIVIAAGVKREADLSLDRLRALLDAAPANSADPLIAGIERARQLAHSILTDDERHILQLVSALPAVSNDPERLRALLDGQPAGPQIKDAGDHVVVGGVRVAKADSAGGAAGSEAPSAEVDHIEAALARLQRLYLLQANSPRLRIPPALREVAPADVATFGERWLAQLAQDALTGRFTDAQFCHDELGNILGAIDYAATSGHTTLVIALSRAISPYLAYAGLWEAWRAVLQQTLTVVSETRAPADHTYDRAWALHQLGTCALGRDAKEAARFWQEALDLREKIGDATGAALTRHNLNQLSVTPGRPEKEPRPIEPEKPIGVGKPIGVMKAAGGASTATKLLIALVIIGLIAGGVLLSGEALVGPSACDRFVPVTREGAAVMSRQIEAAKAMRTGERRRLEFSEEMLSSYVNVFAARSGDLIDGAARLVEPGTVMLCGGLPQTGGLPVAVKVRVKVGAPQPYEVAGTAVRVLNTGGSLGWVAVPEAVAASFGLAERLRAALGDSYIITDLQTPGEYVWVLSIEGR
jgi:hypothetical protein